MGPVNIRLPDSCPGAQHTADPRNNILQDPVVYVACSGTYVRISIPPSPESPV